MHKLIGFILFVFAFVLYLCAPDKYNYDFSKYCALGYLAVVVIYLILKRKRNYFDFDCLFFTGYFFVTLFYPVFMFESDPTKFFMFQYEFDENVIPQASGLALLGITGYIFGALLYYDPDNVKISPKPISFRIPNKHYFIYALISFMCFMLLGGYSALKAAYAGETIAHSGLAAYFFIFCPAFLMAGLLTEFFNFQGKSLKEFWRDASKKNMFIAFFIVFMILITGSRTIPLQVILLTMGIIALLYKNVPLVKFLFIAIAGMLGLALFGILRGTETGSSFSIVDIAMDLIINNRNSYAAIEYVNNKGFTYGESMLSSILAPVPFLQYIFINFLGFNHLSMASSLIITEQTLGEVGELGLGTNIVADLYMAFGVSGVLIFMPLLGYFISITMAKAKSNVYALICYGVMLSYSVFLVRAEYFTFLRFLLWSLLIVFLSRNVRIYGSKEDVSLKTDNK